MLLTLAAGIAHAAAPGTTTISDVIYRANGTPAAGTLLVSWPAFTTRDGQAVAAGSMSLAIGPAGAITVLLAPNEGAIPAGTYYKIVLKLDDGTTSTEYWSVPAGSPTTISAIRTAVMPSTQAALVASRQYVDAGLAAKANDGAVVHNSGDETIAGVKQFAAPPMVPAPVLAAQAANRAYVDSVVNTISIQGDYLRRSGDAMTGALTLAGDPTANNHAANRHYVDIQVAGLSGGLAAKLSRQGDTPITLAGIRYADQFSGGTPAQQIDAAVADCGGSACFVVAPASMAAGQPTSIPANVTFLDLRLGKLSPLTSQLAVPVTAYGAKCDGVTDDTAAFQAAIAATTGHQRRISIPPGKCKIVIPANGVALQIDRPGLEFWAGGGYRPETSGGSSLEVFGGPGVLFQMGTDKGSNWEAGDYDGVQGLTIRDLEIRYADTTPGSRTTLVNGAGTSYGSSYGTGTYAIRDWRGGDVKLQNVTIEQFEYGFWGIQSDLNQFTNFHTNYCHYGAYLGPRSDQSTLIHYSTLWNDTDIWYDRAGSARGYGWQVSGGSPTTPQVKIGSQWSIGADDIVLYDVWFEDQYPNSGTIGSIVEIGIGDSVASSNISFIEPRLLAAPGLVTYFATVGNGTAVSLIRPKGIEVLGNPSGSIFQTLGNTNQKLFLEQFAQYGTGHYLTQSGTGAPVLKILDLSTYGSFNFTIPTGNTQIDINAIDSSRFALLGFALAGVSKTSFQFQPAGNQLTLWDSQNSQSRQSFGFNAGAANVQRLLPNGSFLVQNSSGTAVASVDANGKATANGGFDTGTLATGTRPVITSSTTLNTNFNADMLDGKHATDFLAASDLTAAAVVSKFNSGACAGYLKSDGSCDTPGGAGTVTHAAGSLTLDSPVVGNGAADIKVVAALPWAKVDKTGAAAADVGAVPTARTVTAIAPISGGGGLNADISLGCITATDGQAGCISAPITRR